MLLCVFMFVFWVCLFLSVHVISCVSVHVCISLMSNASLCVICVVLFVCLFLYVYFICLVVIVCITV